MRKRKPENDICDRGYRGRSEVRDTVIHIPNAFSKHLITYPNFNPLKTYFLEYGEWKYYDETGKFVRTKEFK